MRRRGVVETGSGGVGVGGEAVVCAGGSGLVVIGRMSGRWRSRRVFGKRRDLNVGDREVGTTVDDGVQTVCFLNGESRKSTLNGSSKAAKYERILSGRYDMKIGRYNYSHNFDREGRDDQEDRKSDEYRVLIDNHHGKEDDLRAATRLVSLIWQRVKHIGR